MTSDQKEKLGCGRLRIKGRFAKSSDIKQDVTFSWDSIRSLSPDGTIGKPYKFTVIAKALPMGVK